MGNQRHGDRREPFRLANQRLERLYEASCQLAGCLTEQDAYTRTLEVRGEEAECVRRRVSLAATANHRA